MADGRKGACVGLGIGETSHISPWLTSVEAVSNSPDAAKRFLSNSGEAIVLTCQQTVLLYYCNCRICTPPGLRRPGAAVTVKAYRGPIGTGPSNWLVRWEVPDARGNSGDRNSPNLGPGQMGGQLPRLPAF